MEGTDDVRSSAAEGAAGRIVLRRTAARSPSGTSGTGDEESCLQRRRDGAGTVCRMSRVVGIGDSVILLRVLSADDAEAHLAGCDRAIVESIGGEPPTEAQVRNWLTRSESAWVGGEPLVDLGIEDCATGSLCGSVGMQRGLDYLDAGQVNLTYALYPDWRGRGYATRAVRLAMEVARRNARVDQFVIRTASWNGESMRVAQRLGFKFSHTSDDEHGRLEWFIST